MNSPSLQPPVLFVSDAHLGGFSNKENERIESEFIQLINYCDRNEIRLAILGDLFDYWMEYPNFVPDLGKNLLDRFEAFNQKFGPTLFITGNHDNWTLDHLRKRGFYVEHNEYLFDSGKDKIMTLHGDGLSDPRYELDRPLMHRILRHDYFIKCYRSLLPPTSGIKLMKYFSRLTRKFDEGTQKVKKLDQWCRQHLKNSDLDVILCGHDHIPRRKQFAFGTYINLGTFYHHRTMALYNKDGISLVCWKPEMQSLNQFETTD
mgnify:CR=1 FL=1